LRESAAVGNRGNEHEEDARAVGGAAADLRGPQASSANTDETTPSAATKVHVRARSIIVSDIAPQAPFHQPIHCRIAAARRLGAVRKGWRGL